MGRQGLERLPVLADSRQENAQKVNALIKDVQRGPIDGMGKPEPMKGPLGGLWSRRVDEANRIVYYEQDGTIYIISCKGHYED
ncbi:Txe/YoeB family addiction module toxin [Cloacibacillus porcorum]